MRILCKYCLTIRIFFTYIHLCTCMFIYLFLHTYIYICSIYLWLSPLPAIVTSRTIILLVRGEDGEKHTYPADLHPLAIKSKPTVGKYSIYGTYMNIWDTYSRDTTGWQPKSSKPGPSVPTGFGADGTTGRISAAAVEMGVANTPCIVGVTRGYWYWCLLVGCCVLKGLCDSLKWRDGGLKDQVVKPFLRLKDVFLDASNGLKTCEAIYQHHDLSTHDPPLYCAFLLQGWFLRGVFHQSVWLIWLCFEKPAQQSTANYQHFAVDNDFRVSRSVWHVNH